jgi:hypothetical protein
MDLTEDSPSSMWMVRAAELFPKQKLEKEDDELSIPFSERKYGEKNTHSFAKNNNNNKTKNYFCLSFIIFFSCWRECKIPWPLGTWNSCYIQLQILHTTFKEVRNLYSY